MDLEMTGLDPDRHVIVEIASIVTDDDLRIVEEGPDIVVHQPPAALAAMEEVVREMHTRSGLLAAIAASPFSLEEAGATTLAFLRRHIPEPGTVPLCGNSIGTDRRFLARYLPAIEDHLHYRSVDVSTLKELCRRWYPGALESAPVKARNHRALDDVRESVAELRYYRSVMFRDREPAPPASTTAPDGARLSGGA
jgi:oligoribonuclease